MIPQQQRALEIAQTIIKAAFGIADTFGKPIPNAHLLKKRAFPNRSIPHRVKRQMKEDAKREQAFRMALAAIKMASTAANLYRIQSTPIPNYPAGSNNTHD